MVNHENQNEIYNLAFSFIENTGKDVFLTGKAGTGKTFFLKQLKERTSKKFVVVAPTGVAAINALGMTVHSLFNLPLMPYTPDQDNILENIRFDANKRSLLQELELLIIDEVSMLRADTLDAIDGVLRRVRRNLETPFGGLQVLYIGDLFQLAPIVKSQDWEALRSHYQSSFFIDANVYRETKPICLLLEKIYRQKDEKFIELLNNLRYGRNDKATLEELNSYHYPGDRACSESSVVLTTHNRIADEINLKNLKVLPSQAFDFSAKISGDFDEGSYPTEKMLTLKVGAQVMLIKNDKGTEKRYFNGKIGVIENIMSESLMVRFPDGEQLEVQKELWRKMDYGFKSDRNEVYTIETGSFLQFPVRLAWAITVHKSQGLTFDRAIVDVAEAFLPGQVYVALSRISSPEGLALKNPVPASAISCYPRVVQFFEEQETLPAILIVHERERQAFLLKKLLDCFDFSKSLNHIEWASKKFEQAALYTALREVVTTLALHAQRFLEQIKTFFESDLTKNEEKLKSRIGSAVRYFDDEMDHKVLRLLTAERNQVKNFTLQKAYFESLKQTIQVLTRKKRDLDLANRLTNTYFQQQELSPLKQFPQKSGKGNETKPVVSERASKVHLTGAERSLELFKQGKSVKEIAGQSGLTTDAIEHHLSTFLQSGEVSIEDLLHPEQLQQILRVLSGNGEASMLSIRSQVPGVSFGQIKAVMIYRQLLNRE